MTDRSRESLPARVEQRIQVQRAIAQRLQETAAPSIAAPLPFVTLSREYGCEAVGLAEDLAGRLTSLEGTGPWQVYSRQILEDLTRDVKLSPGVADALERTARGGMQEFFEAVIGGAAPDLTVMRRLVSTVRAIALLGRAIIVGRGGTILTTGLKGGVHVRLIAPEEWRLANLVSRFGWEREKARAVLLAEEQHRRTFVEKYLRQDIAAPQHYDVILNVARLAREEQVATIEAVLRHRFQIGPQT